MKTYSFNISSSLTQLDLIKLNTLSDEHRKLYNHLLGLTKTQEVGCDFKKLNSSYVNFRNENKLTISSKSAQNTCRRIITAAKGFFAKRKTDATARFPHKFKSWKYFCSFTYDWNSGGGGFFLKDHILSIRKPEIKIALPEYLRNKDLSDIKTITFSKRKDKYFVSIVVGIGTKDKIKPYNGNWLSIDPGLTSIITGITNTGEGIQYENSTFKSLEHSVDQLKSKRDKKKKYSSRYKKLKATTARKQAKLTNKRKYFHHKLTKEVINFCIAKDITKIIQGDIQTKELTKSKIAHKGLNRATQNRGSLSRIKTFLAYKAKEAGIEHVLQNEAWTSKTNCYTGEIIQNMNLGVRIIDIEGIAIDRDINGAINIANRNLGTWSPQLEWIRNISVSKSYVVC